MVKLFFVILSIGLTVNSIIAKANEKETKKTKFTIDPALLKNAKYEGDLLLKENLRNLFYPSQHARFQQERKKRRVLNTLTLKDLDDIVARLATSAKTMTDSTSDDGLGQDYRQNGDTDWINPTIEDDIDDEGVWYEKSVQPSFEFLNPTTKRFSDFPRLVRILKPNGGSTSNIVPGSTRSSYYQ